MKNSKKKKKKSNSIRTLFLGLIFIAIIGAVLGSFFKSSVEIIDKYREKRRLEARLIYLQEEGEALEIDVEKLKDPEYIGRYLREKYYYSGDGEYIIRIPQSS